MMLLGLRMTMVGKKEQKKKDKTIAGGVIGLTIPLLFARINPFISVEKYYRKMAEVTESLAGEFAGYIPQLTQSLKYSRSYSKKFRNTEKEAQNIIKIIPRFRQYYSLIYDDVKNHRQKQKLNL